MKNEELKNYLLENTDTLKNIITDINGYDGSLDYLEYYENDEEFYNMFFNNNNAMEVARAIFYGEYNFNDDYIKFNAYGNLETCNEWQLEEEYKSYIDDIIDRIIELKDEVIYNYYDEVYEILEKEEEGEE